MSRPPLLSRRHPVTSRQTLARRRHTRAFSTSHTQPNMDKNLRKVVGEDNLKRGPNRYTRLLFDDDNVVSERSERGATPSAVIADLVHKGLAYEALAAGANDPVIRNLLRTFDQMIQHRVAPLAEALAASQRSLQQTQLFIATLFLTATAKFDFPLENCSDEEREEIHELLTVHANDMLNVATTPLPDDTPTHEPPVPTAGSRQGQTGTSLV